MARNDDVTVKDGVEQETVDAVRSLGDKYKHGWATETRKSARRKG